MTRVPTIAVILALVLAVSISGCLLPSKNSGSKAVEPASAESGTGAVKLPDSAKTSEQPPALPSDEDSIPSVPSGSDDSGSSPPVIFD